MEKWKDIEGYEGLYQVSSLGRICGAKDLKERKIQNGPSGYSIITLWKDNVPKTFRVHRLVAQAFLSTDDYTQQINHRSEDKTDNSVSNLEWTTAKNNANYGTRNARISAAMGPLKKSVAQLTFEGDLVNIYPSITDAAIALGNRNKHSNISAVLHDRRQWTYDYCWCYGWEYEKYFKGNTD